MDVVRHEAIGPHRDARLATALAEKIEIEQIVVVAEEDIQAPVAALRDMMRQIGDDETSDAGHGARFGAQRRLC